MPDLTFYIDLDPEIGLSRISHRDKYDRLDQEKFSFHTKVREGYLMVCEMYPKRIVKIDGNQPITTILSQILTRIEQAL